MIGVAVRFGGSLRSRLVLDSCSCCPRETASESSYRSEQKANQQQMKDRVAGPIWPFKHRPKPCEGVLESGKNSLSMLECDKILVMSTNSTRDAVIENSTIRIYIPLPTGGGSVRCLPGCRANDRKTRSQQFGGKLCKRKLR